jgi:hypothetical protein
MNKLTRYGITRNLVESPYTYTMDYGYEELTFHFSSELYLSKFIERYINNRSEVNESLTNRFKIKVKCDILADLKLYSSIEKRGFYIASTIGSITCLSNIRLDGLELIIKS